MNTYTPDVAADRDREKRRMALVRFGLCAVAVLGVGAALTSATWTDDAWFSGEANSASVELQASVNGSDWYEADDSGSAVQIPAETFAKLNQGANKTVTVHLKNASDVKLTLGEGVLATQGALFEGDQPAVATIETPASTELEPGATTTATLKVTTPAGWPDTYQGSEGSLTLKFTGTS